MEIIIWLMITVPCSLLFTGMGIYAWRRKKPMWFWSGSSVREDEISDIPPYNRANGAMWIVYSLVFWVSVFWAYGIYRRQEFCWLWDASAGSRFWPLSTAGYTGNTSAERSWQVPVQR